MYKPFITCVLRTPLLPYSRLNEILKDKAHLLKQFRNPELQEAIFIASPTLHAELIKLLNNEKDEGKEIDRIYNSLVRYISRMSTRCTPFGLFAGCSVGKLDQKTNIGLNDSIKRVTRIDMFLLYTVYDYLMSVPEFRHSLKYYPNTTLYPLGKKYRYVERRTKEKRHQYKVVEIDSSSYLDTILDKAGTGVHFKELVSLIVDDEIQYEESLEFIEELITSQILVGELNLATTGDDFLIQLLKLINKTNLKGSTIHNNLEKISNLLFEINEENSSNIELYYKIISTLSEINILFEGKYLFQTDMIRTTTASYIGKDISEEVLSSLNFLNKITASPLIGERDIDRFEKEFQIRYENQEIPLMKALDPDFGIGYPPKTNRDINPLVDNLALPHKNSGETVRLTPLHKVLLKKMYSNSSNNNFEILLKDEDFENEEVIWGDLPPTLSVKINILKSTEDDVLIKMNYTGGSSAANLLSRFAHTDKEIEQLVKDITSKEQEINKDIILAEIVHLPEQRIGNILSRPHIRDYELLYMGSSDLDNDKLIFMSDLMLSIKNGKLIIKSKTNNKKVLPRFTSAYNYTLNSLPIFRFLCDMQNKDGRRWLRFDWEFLGSIFDYLPRVRYKSTILSEAIWNIKVSDIKYLFDLADEQLIEKVTEWRKNKNIPIYVLMPDDDNELFIDWTSSLSIKAFFSIIKKRQNIRLKEFLFNPKDTVVHHKDNRYVNECILSFHTTHNNKN